MALVALMEQQLLRVDTGGPGRQACQRPCCDPVMKDATGGRPRGRIVQLNRCRPNMLLGCQRLECGRGGDRVGVRSDDAIGLQAEGGMTRGHLTAHPAAGCDIEAPLPSLSASCWVHVVAPRPRAMKRGR